MTNYLNKDFWGIKDSSPIAVLVLNFVEGRKAGREEGKKEESKKKVLIQTSPLLIFFPVND